MHLTRRVRHVVSQSGNMMATSHLERTLLKKVHVPANKRSCKYLGAHSWYAIFRQPRLFSGRLVIETVSRYTNKRRQLCQKSLNLAEISRLVYEQSVVRFGESKSVVSTWDYFKKGDICE